LHSISLQFSHQEQHSSLIPGQSLCSNCYYYIKIIQDGEGSDDPQNDLTCTPKLSTELEKSIHFSFSEVSDSSFKTRGQSNEEKIALSKQK
jgi:hypothetical protein